MTDRVEVCDDPNTGIEWVGAEHYHAQAARIAELEAELEDYQEMNKNQIAIIRQADKRGDGWKASAEAAEAKLAKLAKAGGALFSARSAIEHAIYLLPENANQIRGIKGALAKVESTLAELKGGE